MKGAKYIGKPCRSCGGTERYVAQNRCVPCLDRASADYRKRHPERVAIINTNSSRRQYQTNPEYRRKARQKNERWRKANTARSLEHARRSMAKWRSADPARAVAALRAWRQANPEKERLKNHRRRALLRQASGFCTETQLLARIEYYGYACAYCGAQYEHIDHVIPLSRGGSNWPANLRPACRSCNLAKKARTPLEWKPQSSGDPGQSPA